MAPIPDKAIEQLQHLTPIEAYELVSPVEIGNPVEQELWFNEVGAKVYISALENKNLIGESARKFLILSDPEPLIHEIDNILNELSSADYRIANNQRTIDSLKGETQEILATLQAIVD